MLPKPAVVLCDLVGELRRSPMSFRPYPNVDRALRQIYRRSEDDAELLEQAREAFLVGEREYVLSTRRPGVVCGPS